MMEAMNSDFNSYCTVTNFIKALQTISEDLSVVGLPAVSTFDERNPCPTIVSLINTIWSLLQHRQHLVNSKRDLQQKISVLLADLNYSEDKQKRLYNNFLNNQDSLIKQKKLILLVEEEKSKALQESKCLKKEVQELKVQLKSRELQFKQDFLRQQNEIAVLQTKLRKMIYKEKAETWKGPIDNSTKCKANNDIIKSMEDMYKKSICRVQNNIQTLVQENLELRKTLTNVSYDLTHLLTQNKQHDNSAE